MSSPVPPAAFASSSVASDSWTVLTDVSGWSEDQSSPCRRGFRSEGTSINATCERFDVWRALRNDGSVWAHSFLCEVIGLKPCSVRLSSGCFSMSCEKKGKTSGMREWEWEEGIAKPMERTLYHDTSRRTLGSVSGRSVRPQPE